MWVSICVFVFPSLHTRPQWDVVFTSSFLYPSNTQPLPFWVFSPYAYQTSSLYSSDVLYSLSLSGIQGLKLLSLWPMTSQVTSSLSLTFRVRAALGKHRWTDLPIQGIGELQRGQQGLTLLHYPTN